MKGSIRLDDNITLSSNDFSSSTQTILIASIKLKSTSKGENLYTAPASMQILLYTACRLVFIGGGQGRGDFVVFLESPSTIEIDKIDNSR